MKPEAPYCVQVRVSEVVVTFEGGLRVTGVPVASTGGDDRTGCATKEQNEAIMIAVSMIWTGRLMGLASI
jgi:hypothetical protein